MNEKRYNENAEKDLQLLEKGAFLTTMANDTVNTMTIAWGSIGYMWGKPVFMAMVRKSRFTFELLEKAGEFTVSIPYCDMQKIISFCGSKSGRDVNKFTECGITTSPSQKIDTPIIDCEGAHFECKVLYKTFMDDSSLAESEKRWYPSDDYHMMYFAEIVAYYQK